MATFPRDDVVRHDAGVAVFASLLPDVDDDERDDQLADRHVTDRRAIGCEVARCVEMGSGMFDDRDAVERHPDL